MNNNKSHISHIQNNIVDLLQADPSVLPFHERVRKLKLSHNLEKRIDEQQENNAKSFPAQAQSYLSEKEERELASEVLLCRHQFTEIVAKHSMFRQASLTIIQNIYLFKQRKIFFSSGLETTEQERQKAILLLSSDREFISIPLSNTFQHYIIARVWNRIISTSTKEFRSSIPFKELHDVVENLNTLRNIYMLLSSGLVKKLTTNINQIYRQSISSEDAFQIGNFGIARAAYRYHPSTGVRFSTYAANWIKKEIQRQALENRLIRISSSMIEKYARAAKENDKPELEKISNIFSNATPLECDPTTDELSDTFSQASQSHCSVIEATQTKKLLNQTIDSILSAKSRDIIKRRFGLPPYTEEQSIIEIAKTYKVTRGSIYQLHETALKKLRQHMKHYELV